MHRLILLLTFTESFATILLERGLYFYTYDRLAFSTSANLTLALIFGLMYAAGAWSAHRLCQHISERTLFALLTAGLLIAHLAIGFWPTATGCMVGFPLVGLLSGAKWPIIETYVTAGCTPRKAIAAIGRFNVSWALAVSDFTCHHRPLDRLTPRRPVLSCRRHSSHHAGAVVWPAQTPGASQA